MEDYELLREYAQNQSEAAFAELVLRHVDLVYSAALRLVGEPHFAKDVGQTVFIGLARKPKAVPNPHALGGWQLAGGQKKTRIGECASRTSFSREDVHNFAERAHE
jgi:hypothetical protein